MLTLLVWVLALAAYCLLVPLGERLMVRSRVRVVTAWAVGEGRQLGSVTYRPSPGLGFLLGPVTLLIPRRLRFRITGTRSGLAFDEVVAVTGVIRSQVTVPT